jgi:hypothetical protein
MSFCICSLHVCKFMRDAMKDVLVTTFQRFVDVDIVDMRFR